MKNKKIICFLLIIFLFFDVNGSSGAIKQNSVIECNGIYYGNHGNPTHWHIVEKKGDKWVSISSEVEIPDCYIKKANEMEKVSFSKCSDGDTAHFIINGIDKKVRFLAIDTPEVSSNEEESQRFGKEASEYTCNTLKNANEIYLEYDGNSDKEDKYGRILAFVHVDGVLLEKSLIEQGLARVYYIYGDYAHVDELRKIEEETKSKKIGIWSDDNLADIETTEVNANDDNDKNTFDIIINFIYELLKKLFALLFK